MSQWVVQPKTETSMMHDAIEKYKLMPLLGYEVTTIEDIAVYIYDTNFSQKHEGHRDSKF